MARYDAVYTATNVAGDDECALRIFHMSCFPITWGSEFLGCPVLPGYHEFSNLLSSSVPPTCSYVALFPHNMEIPKVRIPPNFSDVPFFPFGTPEILMYQFFPDSMEIPNVRIPENFSDVPFFLDVMIFWNFLSISYVASFPGNMNFSNSRTSSIPPKFSDVRFFFSHFEFHVLLRDFRVKLQ